MEVDCGEMKEKRGRRVKERLKVKRKKMEELRKYRREVDMLLSETGRMRKRVEEGMRIQGSPKPSKLDKESRPMEIFNFTEN